MKPKKQKPITVKEEQDQIFSEAKKEAKEAIKELEKIIKENKESSD